MRKVIACGLLALGMCVWAQQKKAEPEGSGARELFYFAVAGKDKLPPIIKAKATSQNPLPKGSSGQPPAQPPQGPATVPTGAVHLGMRYALALVNSTTGQSELVDSDRNFKNGECVAIDFESNRSGYLYVLAKQSSGDWLPLLPSQEMPSEGNVINPGEKTRVPREFCFEVHNPPGVEKLFVVLARDPQDIYQLNQGIKGGDQPKPARVSAPQMLVADGALVNKEVQRMEQQFGTRDLVFRKVNQPVDKTEPAHSVYVVNASAKPATHLSMEITINHK